ncbi:hypothetical protein ACA910_012300 [Epithemia clementina (nom. ined.)]
MRLLRNFSSIASSITDSSAPLVVEKEEEEEEDCNRVVESNNNKDVERQDPSIDVTTTASSETDDAAANSNTPRRRHGESGASTPTRNSSFGGGRRHRSLSWANKHRKSAAAAATSSNESSTVESSSEQQQQQPPKRERSRSRRQRSSSTKNNNNNNNSGTSSPPLPKSGSTSRSSSHRPMRRRRWSTGTGDTPTAAAAAVATTTSTGEDCQYHRSGSTMSKSSSRTIQTADSTDSCQSPLLGHSRDGIFSPSRRNVASPVELHPEEGEGEEPQPQENALTDSEAAVPSLSSSSMDLSSDEKPPSELALPDLETTQEDDDDDDDDEEQREEDVAKQDGDEEEEEEEATAMREEEASVERFQQMLQRDDLTTIEQINLLYALGRLSAKMGRYEQALEYHQAELELTEELVDETAKQGTVGAVVVTETGDVARENDAVARVLDGMARIAKQGLGNSEAALSYHRASLHNRRTLQERILEEARQHCANCKPTPQQQPRTLLLLRPSRGGRPPHTSGTTVSLQLCACHARALSDTVKAMEATRHDMGRILFEQGQVNRAVQLITKIAPPSAPPALSRPVVPLASSSSS